MDRHCCQDNDDAEPEYDVVNNLEVQNLHVSLRLMDNKEYAGRSSLPPFYSDHLRLKSFGAWNLLVFQSEYFHHPSISTGEIKEKGNARAQARGSQLQTLFKGET